MNFPHHDPAWLERMYNNRALVPDHVDYLQRWADASVPGAHQWACALDIAYGSGTGEALDIFAPHVPGRSPPPVLVFIHGGTGAHSTSLSIPFWRLRSHARESAW